MFKIIQTIAIVSFLTFGGLYNAMSAPSHKVNNLADKNLHMSIELIDMGHNDFPAYGQLFKKPLVPVLTAATDNNITPVVTPAKTSNSVFTIAMQMQDKAQYYFALLENLLLDSPQPYDAGECGPSRIARLF